MFPQNILIVEDNLIIAADIKDRLEKSGYIVYAIVTSGEKALIKLNEFNTDLVLLDIILKGKMTGIETGLKIRKGFRIPVLYITANVEMLKKANIKDPFISKPFTDDELKKMVSSILYKKHNKSA